MLGRLGPDTWLRPDSSRPSGDNPLTVRIGVTFPTEIGRGIARFLHPVSIMIMVSGSCHLLTFHDLAATVATEDFTTILDLEDFQSNQPSRFHHSSKCNPRHSALGCCLRIVSSKPCFLTIATGTGTILKMSLPLSIFDILIMQFGTDVCLDKLANGSHSLSFPLPCNLEHSLVVLLLRVRRTIPE